MRTTLTLDGDVAAKLAAEARRSGRSFKEVVNACLRMALNAKRPITPAAVKSPPAVVSSVGSVPRRVARSRSTASYEKIH